MPRLNRLSAAQVLTILGQFGFQVISQRGSHIKLRRLLTGGERQTLTIPNHNQLDLGTLAGIYRQALRYISERELKPHFYSN
jgi:predicted RNA binding protein YcfA (HicA-like mRNA interferase family)